MGILNFSITKLWDGSEKSTESQGRNVHITLKAKTVNEKHGVSIEIVAPYFNDPKPNGPEGAFFQLWDYEVVEAFFLAPGAKDDDLKDLYLELEFGPHSHHLALLLKGRKNIIKHSMPLQYEAKIDYENESWHGKAWIPMDFFPPGVTKFNAYAIHGTGDDRSYEALFPVPGDVPDFHRLNHFQPIDFERLLPDDDRAKSLSELWESVLQSS